MKRPYVLLSSFIITFLVIGARSYAQDTNQFNHFVQSLHDHRFQMEARLGIDPSKDIFPQPTCYYDDLEDHYEQDQLMRDTIDQGIR